MDFDRLKYFMTGLAAANFVLLIVIVLCYIIVSFATLSWMPIDPLVWNGFARGLLMVGEIGCVVLACVFMDDRWNNCFRWR